MPMWRCPHCGTPQAETARCWVCRRSSTACGTCRHFRRAVAANLGYCGLDRRRSPLTGDEIQACWEPSTTIPGSDINPTIGPAAPPPPIAVGAVGISSRLEFIEVGGAPPMATRLADEDEPPTIPSGRDSLGWSLFGDLDR